MPLAIEQLDLSDANIIISSAHSVAKVLFPDQISFTLAMFILLFDMRGIYSISTLMSLT